MNLQKKLTRVPADSGSLNRDENHLDALHRMEILQNYYGWTYSLMKPFIGRRVLDAGCGIGNLTHLLLDQCEHVLAVDSNQIHLDALKDRFRGRACLGCVHLDLQHSDLSVLGKDEFDTIVCLDVLEHIEDDVGLMRRFAEIARKQCRLLIKAPAGPRLFGPVDIASGHYRRYSCISLSERAIAGGWNPIRIQYMNLFGLLPYWIKCTLLKNRRNFSRTFSINTLKLVNRVIPALQRLDGLVGPPIGLSIVLVAEKR